MIRKKIHHQRSLTAGTEQLRSPPIELRPSLPINEVFGVRMNVGPDSRPEVAFGKFGDNVPRHSIDYSSTSSCDNMSSAASERPSACTSPHLKKSTRVS